MKILNTIGLAIAISVLAPLTSFAASNAGHSKDYRTFHSNGTIDYGKIGDSYS